MDPNRIQLGQLHTPTQSFQEQQGNSSGQGFNMGEKKLRDEYEHAQSKLTDQKFDIKAFPDPLLPRTIPKEAHLPQGTSLEQETHLQSVIDKVKAGQAAIAKVQARRT